MPKPVYIICAKDVSEDKTTNLVSAFSLIEQIEVKVQKAEDESRDVVSEKNRVRLESTVLHAYAVWMRDDNDGDDVFEHEFALYTGDQENKVVSTGQFNFESELPARRFHLTLMSVPILEESTILKVESRVRKQGAENWTRQAYPILYKVVHKSATADH